VFATYDYQNVSGLS